MKMFITFSFLLFSQVAFAQEVTELSLDPAVCELRERGAMVKEDPIWIKGKKTESGCLAFIEDKIFSKKFNFCVHSGFEMAGGDQASYYACTLTREKDSFMFRSYMNYEGLSSKPDLICNFMCFIK